MTSASIESYAAHVCFVSSLSTDSDRLCPLDSLEIEFLPLINFFIPLARSIDERLDPGGIASKDKRLFVGGEGESFPDDWSERLSFRERDLLLRGLGS